MMILFLMFEFNIQNELNILLDICKKPSDKSEGDLGSKRSVKAETR